MCIQANRHRQRGRKTKTRRLQTQKQGLRQTDTYTDTKRHSGRDTQKEKSDWRTE